SLGERKNVPDENSRHPWSLVGDAWRKFWPMGFGNRNHFHTPRRCGNLLFSGSWRSGLDIEHYGCTSSTWIVERLSRFSKSSRFSNPGRRQGGRRRMV